MDVFCFLGGICEFFSHIFMYLFIYFPFTWAKYALATALSYDCRPLKSGACEIPSLLSKKNFPWPSEKFDITFFFFIDTIFNGVLRSCRLGNNSRRWSPPLPHEDEDDDVLNIKWSAPLPFFFFFGGWKVSHRNPTLTLRFSILGLPKGSVLVAYMLVSLSSVGGAITYVRRAYSEQLCSSRMCIMGKINK